MTPTPLASRVLATALALATIVACGGTAPDARYPAREDGCPVKRYAGPATTTVDDLGVVRVECGAGEAATCERQLENAVCKLGGDVVYNMGDAALNATTLQGHAAHTRRVTQGPHERGCAVEVFAGAPPMRTENIGPVTALCNEDDARDVCERELEDQVCLLGGDVLWQTDGPTPVDTSNGRRLRMHGRAAHSK